MEIAVMNVRTSIAPLPMRSYVGLGLGYSCIIVEHGIWNINMCDMLGSMNDVVHVHR